MRARAQANKTVIPVRVAIMAALEIADNLFERAVQNGKEEARSESWQ